MCVLIKHLYNLNHLLFNVNIMNSKCTPQLYLNKEILFKKYIQSSITVTRYILNILIERKYSIYSEYYDVIQYMVKIIPSGKPAYIDLKKY